MNSNKLGLWYCTNCDNVEPREREVLCWKCGKGEMVFREHKLEDVIRAESKC